MRVGVDFGTSTISMCVEKNGSRELVKLESPGSNHNIYSIPSAVCLEETTGKLLVGYTAKRSKLIKPECYKEGFKRNLGEVEPIRLGYKDYMPEQLFTEVLVCLKNELEKREVIKESVDYEFTMCHPANFSNRKRNLIKQAALDAGFKHVQLLDEPTAAAYYYDNKRNINDNDILLIYDLGGGTFDVSLMKKQNGKLNLLTNPLGIEECGGTDFDTAIYEDFVMGKLSKDTKERIQKFSHEQKMILKSEIEEECIKAKILLSSASQAKIKISALGQYPVLTKNLFEDIISHHVDETIDKVHEIIKNANITSNDVDRILLVGGSCRIPYIKERLVKEFGNKIAENIDPDWAVVYGSTSQKDKGQEYYENGLKHYVGEGVLQNNNKAAYWFEKAAEKGNIDAMEAIALCYIEGVGVAKDMEQAIPWLKKAAECGNAGAQNRLGYAYTSGSGVTKNNNQGYKWYLKAAKQGNAAGQENAGDCLYHGVGVVKCFDRAVSWYRKAAEQGRASAQNSLGVCYYNGKGTELDYKKAINWFEKAANQGDSDGQNNLGECYYNGLGIHRDYTKAVGWYRKAAEQGDANGQYNLAECYFNGTGVIVDYAVAVHWYKKAAELGHIIAQSDLGYCYHFGKGISRDIIKAKYWYEKAVDKGNIVAQHNLGFLYYQQDEYQDAVKWFKKAASEGHATAQLYLGVCYKRGQGVNKDFSKAAYWYKEAAEQGNGNAQNNLGLCYYEGKGVPKDYKKAIYWYEKAIKQGIDVAYSNLGVCYECGCGVAKDLTKAASYYEKSARRGSDSGQFNLGDCYEYGKGVMKDKKKAKYWYKQAAAQGHKDAEKKVNSWKFIFTE